MEFCVDDHVVSAHHCRIGSTRGVEVIGSYQKNDDERAEKHGLFAERIYVKLIGQWSLCAQWAVLTPIPLPRAYKDFSRRLHLPAKTTKFHRETNHG